MTDKINFNYLESYAQKASESVCDEYFRTKKYMTGQEIIQLTPSQQVNLLTIRSLFNAWQEEMEELKNSPYFDYRDIAVDNALKDFMNVLSRSIKVERKYFEPLLKEAIEDAIILAIDPFMFFNILIDKGQNNEQYYKDSKKYIKWHGELLTHLGDKASMGLTVPDLKMALRNKYQSIHRDLDNPEILLKPLNQIHQLELIQLFEDKSDTPSTVEPTPKPEPTPETSQKEKVAKEEISTSKQTETKETQPSKAEPQVQEPTFRDRDKAIDPALAWAKFESETYSYMKGSIDTLTDGLALNQKFMFTRELFQGNHDLMKHALKSIDNCESFMEAIELINKRYVHELNWDKHSEEVNEFLQLVFRKFENK
ncbi:hypothetical protein [Litoribacter populi]|uniref:hypothetical protein n=1 Tax=Litoribacter populi TaxID=2598460 RepID=UPI00117DA771|nr:hypothetical protein [Litoribacter populi]